MMTKKRSSATKPIADNRPKKIQKRIHLTSFEQEANRRRMLLSKMNRSGFQRARDAHAKIADTTFAKYWRERAEPHRMRKLAVHHAKLARQKAARVNRVLDRIVRDAI